MNTSDTTNNAVKRFFESRRRFLIRASVMLLVVGSMSVYAGTRFSLGYETQDEFQCLPWTLFLIDKHDTNIEKGHYFAYSAKGMEPLVANGTIALKKAAAGPGDLVRVELDRTWVEDQPQPNSELMFPDAIKPLYESMESLTRELVVPEGEFFAMGTLLGSYDSRYWGTVKSDQVIGRVYPLY